MGYNSTARGEWTIQPSLTATEMRTEQGRRLCFPNDEAAMKVRGEAYVLVNLKVTETEEGANVTFSGTKVVPVGPGKSWKRYSLDEELEEILEAFPGHEFGGRIENRLGR